MRIRIIDAFADRPFTGNPAAVCLLDAESWPDQYWMQRIAAEMNLSATAFAYPLPENAAADWTLRWFTPTAEADLCGHATLATVHALHSDRAAASTIRFNSRSGILVAHIHHDGTITLDFPAARVTEIPIPHGLPEALRAQPDATYGTGILSDLLAVFPDEASVRGLDPDVAALAHLTRREGSRGVIATAPASNSGGGYDFVSRFFAPAVGIPEDPVTGSAHTALASYWSGRLGQPSLTGLQASVRTGLVRTTIHGDRVHLTGRAITILDGTLRHFVDEKPPPALRAGQTSL